MDRGSRRRRKDSSPNKNSMSDNSSEGVPTESSPRSPRSISEPPAESPQRAAAAAAASAAASSATATDASAGKFKTDSDLAELFSPSKPLNLFEAATAFAAAMPPVNYYPSPANGDSGPAMTAETVSALSSDSLPACGTAGTRPRPRFSRMAFGRSRGDRNRIHLTKIGNTITFADKATNTPHHLPGDGSSETSFSSSSLPSSSIPDEDDQIDENVADNLIAALFLSGPLIRPELLPGRPYLPRVARYYDLQQCATEEPSPSNSSRPSTENKASASDGGNNGEEEEPREKKTRCDVCNKKLGLITYSCRCGGTFCAVHRYSDKHNCTYDYRGEGAEEIRRNNPVVTGEKIRKI